MIRVDFYCADQRLPHAPTQLEQLPRVGDWIRIEANAWQVWQVVWVYRSLERPRVEIELARPSSPLPLVMSSFDPASPDGDHSAKVTGYVLPSGDFHILDVEISEAPQGKSP